jgi:hypothetical protein
MQYQYFNSRILLVVNPKGLIKKLFTPFRVQDRINNSWVYVDEILTNESDELIFLIGTQQYPHHNFVITIHF